jgi:hypothetical protein
MELWSADSCRESLCDLRGMSNRRNEKCHRHERRRICGALFKGPKSLTKVIPIIGMILMALHIIWPLNLPGLRKRRDFWKIAVVMGIAIVFTALLRDQMAISP